MRKGYWKRRRAEQDLQFINLYEQWSGYYIIYSNEWMGSDAQRSLGRVPSRALQDEAWALRSSRCVASTGFPRRVATPQTFLEVHWRCVATPRPAVNRRALASSCTETNRKSCKIATASGGSGRVHVYLVCYLWVLCHSPTSSAQPKYHGLLLNSCQLPFSPPFPSGLELLPTKVALLPLTLCKGPTLRSPGVRTLNFRQIKYRMHFFHWKRIWISIIIVSANLRCLRT
jgi:hypothetical protein